MGIYIVLMILVVFAMVMTLAYFHRSNPKNRKVYETTNPLIKEKVQLSAHRSGGGIYPEETRMAFRSCVENPALHVDCFEFDLHLTKDGKLVLIHDSVLDRTSDAETVFGKTGLVVEDMTVPELKKLNMGAKFSVDGKYPYAAEPVSEDLRISTIEEILDYLISKGQFNYIIELKNGGEKGERSVDIIYQVLKERNLLDRAIIGSFQPAVAQRIDSIYPDMRRGANPKEVVEFYFAALRGKKEFPHKYSALQIPYSLAKESRGLNLGTTQLINYAHKNNIAVQYWTVNKTEDMFYLASIGADCIMTDYPDKAQFLVRRVQ